MMATLHHSFRAFVLGTLLVGALCQMATATWAGGPYDALTVPPCRIVDTRLAGGEIQCAREWQWQRVGINREMA